MLDTKRNALAELAEKLSVDADVVSAYKDELGEGKGTVGQLLQDDLRKAQRIVAELAKVKINSLGGPYSEEESYVAISKCRAIAEEGKCYSCKIENGREGVIFTADCMAYWLALEAEEKPEPCFYCGSRMSEGQSSDGKLVLICDNRNCGYITPKSNTRAAAIAAHNRVARAVRAAKENN